MDIPQYLDRAKQALQDGEFDLAAQYYKQILKQFPHHPEANQGMKDIQVALAKKRIPPWFRELHLLWLSFQTLMGRGQQCYPKMELLYQCQPDHTRTALAFAKCAEKAGHLEEAHEAYSRVLKLNNTHQKALAADAEILVQLDRLDEAAQLYNRLLHLRPDDDQINHRLRDISARSYARVGIPENLKARRAAIEKEKLEAPAPPEVMEQIQDLLEIYQKNPDRKEAGVEIARRYREADIYDQANKILSDILDQNPHYEPARREQARVWRQSGDLAIAQSLFKELLEASPQDLSLKDEYLQTTLEFMEAEGPPQGDQGEFQRQVERIKIERDQNRIHLLESLITDHPEAFEERLELSELYLQNGRARDAVPVLQRVVQEPSFAGRGFFLLGQCFRANGDTALAVQQFEKALAFFKNKGYSHVLSDQLKMIYYYMGISKEELGDKQGAKAAYGEVYSTDINFKDIRHRYENLFT